MATCTRKDPPPQPPPVFVLELSEDEVLALRSILGAMHGGFFRSESDAIYYSISRALTEEQCRKALGRVKNWFCEERKEP